VLARGDVLKPLAEVGPGSLPFFADLPAKFNLPPDHTEDSRRVALAKWLTDAKNPHHQRALLARLGVRRGQEVIGQSLASVVGGRSPLNGAVARVGELLFRVGHHADR